MFRKPKRSAKKAGLRQKTDEDEDENSASKHSSDSDNDNDDDQQTSLELHEARKRAKFDQQNKTSKGTTIVSKDNFNASMLHKYEQTTTTVTQKELATSTNEYHPTDMAKPDPKRNKFLAGPIRAPTNIRTTCRFDYQPDICKDYKDTGFCGFGDTCIYLHDRGDTMSGWQLEQVWQKQQEEKKLKQEQQMEQFLMKHTSESGDGDNDKTRSNTATIDIPDDGLPFACYLCRKPFEDPIVTTCGHYFCQSCLQQYQQEQHDSSNANNCPVCQKDTHGVMNQPTKLLTKKRKLVGRDATWEEFMKACTNTATEE